MNNDKQPLGSDQAPPHYMLPKTPHERAWNVVICLTVFGLAVLLVLLLTGCTLPDWPKPEPDPTPVPVEPVEGSHAMLWKPVAEGDGNLVTLFPCQYRLHMVHDVRVVYAGGVDRPYKTYMPEGSPNGNRVHSRWRKPGMMYGKEIRLIISLPDHDVSWEIDNGAKRDKQGDGTHNGN